MSRLVAASIAALTLVAPPSFAQTAAPRKIAVAARTAEAPTVDGNVDDRAWQQATLLADFVQSEPLEGQPASEKTEVRLLYDDRYIYVGVICYDSDPSQINISDTRRDASMSDMDSFQVIFDTYRD